MKRLSLFLSLLTTLFCCSCTGEPQIITTVDKIADGEWQCFTKEFVLLAPKSAELRIAADTKYWLFVNGELVVREGGLKRGPTPADSYCDVLASVPNLKFGKNRVVVLVQYYGRNSFSHRPSACPGLSFDLNTKLGRVVSDNSWKAIRYDAFWAPADENPAGVKDGIKIGVQQDTTGDIYSSDKPAKWGFGEDNVVRYKTGADAVQALKSGKVTAVIIDNEPAKSFVAANDGLKILDGEYANEDYAICVAKENTELLDSINKALAELQADGTVDKIIKKYIPAE